MQIANTHTWATFTAPDEGQANDGVLVGAVVCRLWARRGLSEVKVMYEAPERLREKVFAGWDG